MKVHRFWILTLICFTIVPSSLANDPRIVCYYTNWSIYRPGNAKYSPQNINPYLCTHLIYAFGGFTKDNTLQPFDKYQDIEKGGYAKFTGLKTYNKNLKTLLAIGGWNEGSARFSPLVSNAERRREFVKNTVKYLRQNHFDGLDLDWEYPTFRDGGKSKDRANYAQLVQELSEEFDRESSKTGRIRLLLTLAIPAGVDKIEKGYDIVKLNQYLDWFNVLTYDYHDSFEPATNHHAPLYPLEEDNEYNYDAELNIDFSVKHLINAGADRQKLVLGIPTYGRSYTLFNSEATEIGAPTDGPGEPGDATREKGFLAYYEICQNIKSDNEWTVMHPNDKAMGPYSYKNDQWISYDDEKMARQKAMYVAENNLGGIMFWSIDTDDFRGTCSGKPYPLIEAAKESLLDALGIKSIETKEPVIKTTTRNRYRPSAEQKNPTNVKDNFNRRRPSAPKTTSRPTQPAIVYNSKTTTPEPPTTPDPGSDFKCEEDGFFPHPRDCKRYFWCLDSGPSNLGIVAHQFTCPSGLVFNKQADSCDYSRNVVCAKTSPTTTKAPRTTTYKTTTKQSTTQRTTTYLPRTTTTTTPAYEDDEEIYDYESGNTELDRDIEDPKVIKELIDLIKKAGGLEELEKHFKFTEENLSVIDSIKPDKIPTTQSTFSKSLYDKFLKRKQLENRPVKTENTNNVKPATEVRYENVNTSKSNSTRYSSVIRNSRPNPQNAGLDDLPDFDAFLKEKPKYVTIQRFRTTTEINLDSIQDDDDDDEQDSHKINYDRDDKYSNVETATKPSNSQPQYVNIKRNRFTTQSTVVDEEFEQNKFVQNPLIIESITNAPQYTTINRRRRPEIKDTDESLADTTSPPTITITSRPQSKYKPISRVTTATPPVIIDLEPDSTKNYYESRQEIPENDTEREVTTYQNFNRRTLITTSLDPTLPTKIDDTIIELTTNLISPDYDNNERDTTQKDIPPETTQINLKLSDEPITSSNVFDSTTPNLSTITEYPGETGKINLNSDETFNGLNDTSTISISEQEVVTAKNVIEITTTLLSSPSPFEFQKENNIEPLLNQTLAVKGLTTFSVEDIARVAKPNLTRYLTTTTNKPITLNHIFSISYDSAAADDSNINTDLGFGATNADDVMNYGSKEEISRRLEKLVEINRIVVIHSKQEKHNTKSNTADYILETLPTIDKIGEISRWISIKLQNNNNNNNMTYTNDPINSTYQTQAGYNVLDSRVVFDVETSTIPLEGLFDQNKILTDNPLDDNEATNYQITKPPVEIITFESTVPTQYEKLQESESNEDNVTVTGFDRSLLDQPSKVRSSNKITYSSPISRQTNHRNNITPLKDIVVNCNSDTVNFQVNPIPNSTIFRQTSSTLRPHLNFKKKGLPPRVSPSVLRRKTSFTTSTTQSSLNVSQRTTPKIFARRKLYSRPSAGTAQTRPVTESTTIISGIDPTPEPKRTRRPTFNISSKFVRPLRRKNNNVLTPQTNISTIIDDQFLSQTITTNNKQLATGLADYNNNSSFVDDEISDILKAMSKTPLPVTPNGSKMKQTVKNRTLSRPPSRRPSRPESIRDNIPIKSTTEGRRKLFQKTQPKNDNESIPKTYPKLPKDYDYYDDNESRIGHRENSQVKVVLHETGAIECLDQGNFPHPLSCKKFISCAKIETGGVVGWEYTCPKGLNYDPVGGMCNWATGLGCKD